MPLPNCLYSSSFAEYKENRHEVVEILRIAPSDSDQLTSRRKREVAHALYRGSVMLLSAHLEKYVESLVVEAIDTINKWIPPVSQIPEALRLLQIEQEFAGMWSSPLRDHVKITTQIKASVSQYPWIWSDIDPCGKMSGECLIGKNKFSNPSPGKINDLFKFFGIANVVGKAVGMDGRPDCGLIEIKVEELIQKRNDIAHTATTPTLTRQDVVDYLTYSRRLVRGVDIVVGQRIQVITGHFPW